MSTPAPMGLEVTAEHIDMVVSQLNLAMSAASTAPESVKVTGLDFIMALKDWADKLRK